MLGYYMLATVDYTKIRFVFFLKKELRNHKTFFAIIYICIISVKNFHARNFNLKFLNLSFRTFIYE